MKNLIDRIPPFLRNFYFLSSFFFLGWLLLFDSNDIVTQIKLSKKQAELEKTRSFYEEKIVEVKSDREALLNSDDLLERLAREKYFMKRENEDVFVIVEE